MTARAKWLLAGLFCCLLGFATLLSLAYGGGSFGVTDARIVHRLYGYRGTGIESLAHVFYDLASPLPQLVLLAGACAISWRRGCPRRALWCTALVVCANATTQLLKLAVSHPRYQAILGLWQINPSSFPSGHSTAALSMALVYFTVAPDRWRPAVVGLGVPLVLAVGCSVVVLHYHYPSDVLGGWLVAAAWFFALALCLRTPGREAVGAEAGVPRRR